MFYRLNLDLNGVSGDSGIRHVINGYARGMGDQNWVFELLEFQVRRCVVVQGMTATVHPRARVQITGNQRRRPSPPTLVVGYYRNRRGTTVIVAAVQKQPGLVEPATKYGLRFVTPLYCHPSNSTRACRIPLFYHRLPGYFFLREFTNIHAM